MSEMLSYTASYTHEGENLVATFMQAWSLACRRGGV